MKRILIAGITGQDGSLLFDFLKNKKFKILGLSRKKNKLKHVKKTDYSLNSLKKIIISFKPNEIYNLCGLTKPSLSWEKPFENFDANLHITLNFLEIIKNLSRKIKYFNASSSEIFKDIRNNKLNENSQIYPSNPYGIAKSASHFFVNAYRKKYNLFLVNGILFNHESYKNNESYLLKYLLKSSIKLKENKIKKISVIDSRPVRDFGCAKDYVNYIYKLMQLNKPEDFIVATGKFYSVKEVIKIYQKKFNLSSKNFKFNNSLDFRFANKYKLANNNKIKKSLKLKKIKNITNLIDTIETDLNFL